MAEATSIEFSHIIQLYLTFKTKQTRNKFPANLDSFFTEVGSQMVVSGELNNGREAGGRMAGKGFMKNVVRGRWTSEIDLDMGHTPGKVGRTENFYLRLLWWDGHVIIANIAMSDLISLICDPILENQS